MLGTGAERVDALATKWLWDTVEAIVTHLLLHNPWALHVCIVVEARLWQRHIPQNRIRLEVPERTNKACSFSVSHNSTGSFAT